MPPLAVRVARFFTVAAASAAVSVVGVAGPALASRSAPAARTVPATGPALVAPAAEQADTQWSVTPSDAEGPDGRVSLRHIVDPGATVEDHIAVTNLGTDPAAFDVAAGDGILADNGAFDISAEPPSRGGAWIDIDGLDGDGTLALEPEETRILPVTVSVPADATPGDSPAGIVVSRTASDSDVTVTHRIGVRVHLRVAGDVESSIDVESLDVGFAPSWIPFAPGRLDLSHVVANDGNVRLGAASTLAASGPFGSAPVEAREVVDELLPGDSSRVSATTTVWPLGVVRGQVTVEGLVVGEDGVPAPARITVPFTRPAVSWTGVALVVGAAALVVVLVARGRHRSARPE